jgi:hypothetical protein
MPSATILTYLNGERLGEDKSAGTFPWDVKVRHDWHITCPVYINPRNRNFIRIAARE